MLPRTALPVLCLRNDREISIASIEHNDDYPQKNDRLKIQNAMSNHNIPYSNVFKTYSVEYASDPRFKVQGKVLPGTLNLESWIRGVFNRIRFEYV